MTLLARSEKNRGRNVSLMRVEKTVIAMIENTIEGHTRRMSEKGLLKQVWDWIPRRRRKMRKITIRWMQRIRSACGARGLKEDS